MKNKNLVLGITAGIAIYKVCELIRLLKKLEFSIKCIITQSAAKLISPLLFEYLSQDKVYTDMFENFEYDAVHVSLADWANIVVVVPCSCNTLAKLASGKTEDLLSCVIYACDLKKTKVLLCPSMNSNMYLHPITQKNLNILKRIGYNILPPVYGELLCKKSGIGRLPTNQQIVDKIKKLLDK